MDSRLGDPSNTVDYGSKSKRKALCCPSSASSQQDQRFGSLMILSESSSQTFIRVGFLEHRGINSLLCILDGETEMTFVHSFPKETDTCSDVQPTNEVLVR